MSLAPSSGAPRHLLPRGEKEERGKAVPHLPSPLVGEGPSGDEGDGTPGFPDRTGFARHLRRNSTEAEKQLWRLLRDRRFVGFKFRRQVPVIGYVADFLCYEAKLIVELDGSQHAESVRDKVRDNRLATAGFRVLRVWNNDLTNNRQGVLEAIWSALAAAPSSGAARHLLPRGEKEEGGKAVPDLPSPLVGEGPAGDEGVAANATAPSERKP